MKRIAEFKEKHKDLLENLVPTDEKEAFTQHNVVNVLKERDHKGRRILLVNCGGAFEKAIVNSCNSQKNLIIRLLGYFESHCQSTLQNFLFNSRSRCFGA